VDEVGPDEKRLSYEAIIREGEMQVSRSPWGPDDEIGRLNWMTPAGQAALLARIDGGRAFDLSVDYFMGMPSWTSAMDPKYDIWMTHTPQGTVNDNLTGLGPAVHRTYSYSGSAVTMYTHTGTHLCSLNHIGLWGRFWNGWTPDTDLGSRAWRVGGNYPLIVGRAVLVDVAGARSVDCLPDSYAITAADIRATLDHQAVELRQGDIALVRTGRMTRWPDQERFLASPPGLGMESARLLCEEIGVMCAGVDAGGEALPPERPDSFLPVHAYLLATAGTPLFENLWLEELAREKVYESVLVALPLKLLGSTGVPVRPVAFPFKEGAPGTLS
jgi:kynurenine formamidase